MVWGSQNASIVEYACTDKRSVAKRMMQECYIWRKKIFGCSWTKVKAATGVGGGAGEGVLERVARMRKKSGRGGISR